MDAVLKIPVTILSFQDTLSWLPIESLIESIGGSWRFPAYKNPPLQFWESRDNDWSTYELLQKKDYLVYDPEGTLGYRKLSVMSRQELEALGVDFPADAV